MSREIKFRAWDTQNEAMTTDQDEEAWFEFGVDGLELVQMEQYFETGSGHAEEYWKPLVVKGAIFEQFTGLQDRNGVDIYESDHINSRYIVRWDAPWCRYVLTDISNSDITVLLSSDSNHLEVTGNEHEGEFKKVEENT